MKKNSFLLTALGASLLLNVNSANAITPNQINTVIESYSNGTDLRILTNGFGYLHQGGHIYILSPKAASSYSPDQLTSLLRSGDALICNVNNCKLWNISTEGLELLE